MEIHIFPAVKIVKQRVLIQLPSAGIVVARVRRGGVVGHRFGTFQGDGQLIRRNGIPGADPADPH